MSLWDKLPPEELRTMHGFSDHRNVYDLQRIAAIKKLEREIAEDHANGYCVDEKLDRLAGLRELVRTGPHS